MPAFDQAYVILGWILSTGILIVYIFLLRNKLNYIKEENIRVKESSAQLYSQKIAIESILQAIDDGIIITNYEGNITMASKKAMDILRTEFSNLAGKPIDSILPVDPINRAINSNKVTKLQILTGETIMAKLESLPILTSGEVKGTVYTIHNITKEKEFEEMKLDFVTMAVHQLRTPLTTLRGYLSVLSGNIADKLLDDEKVYLDRSISGADQISALIENLINITHMEENKLTLQTKQVQLEDTVEDVTNNLSIIGKQKGVRLLFQKPQKPLPLISIDSYSISQVLNNLIVNAIEHSSEGSSVEIYIRQQGDEIVVDVKDYGEGIPYEATEFLFTKFYQVPNNLRAGSKGMGLGLYISKKILEAHKGKIWVNTIRGRGATFSFSLPIHQPSPQFPHPHKN